MAHDKVYGIYENKCREEVYPKTETYSKEETDELLSNGILGGVMTLTNPYGNKLDHEVNTSLNVSGTIPKKEGYHPICVIPLVTKYAPASTVIITCLDTTNVRTGQNIEAGVMISPYVTLSDIDPTITCKVLYAPGKDYYE